MREIENFPRVALLPPEVAERIAAGEVIERPSSVVKELVENSLDAGATEVAVHLESGGKSLIEVLDNGRGMSRDDLILCIERHATSKLKNLDDLERLVTLGFRGEALPSIAAVSELSLISRQAGHSQAWEINKATSGKFGVPQAITFGHFLGTPHGTRIRAESLFSQMPARLKFLRSEGAEVSQVREWMERLSLGRPDVGMRLLSHDRSLFSVRPGTRSERVRDVLSEGSEFPIREGKAEDNVGGGARASVYWLEGLSVPHSRKIAQVVNGRSVKDRVLQQALLQPFRQALLPGRFPALVLYLELPPSDLDVNVHPTKTEVRFLDSKKIFSLVVRAVESLMAEQGNTIIVAPAMKHGGNETPALAPSIGWNTSWATERIRAAESQISALRSNGEAPQQQVFEQHAMSFNSASLPDFLVEGKTIGTLFETYVLHDNGDELVLIDQHAAHERIRYEKLKSQVFSSECLPPNQQLLLPEVVRFLPEQRMLLESRLSWISKLGFECEIFGKESVVFRAVPTAWGTRGLALRLKSLIDRVIEIDSEETELALDEMLFEKLASEACHSAIRAGDSLDTIEVISLIRDLFQCEHPWNCPHGRPTVVRIPRLKFEEWFQRKV